MGLRCESWISRLANNAIKMVKTMSATKIDVVVHVDFV